MSLEDSDGEDPAILAERVSDEARLRELEERLEKLKEPVGGQSKTVVRGIGLVTSMGAVLAGCLLAGLYGGQYLAERTGQPAVQVVGLVLGLAAALFAVGKLMGPFLRSERS